MSGTGINSSSSSSSSSSNSSFMSDHNTNSFQNLSNFSRQFPTSLFNSIGYNKPASLAMSGTSDLLMPQYQFPFYQLFPQFQAAQSILGMKQEDRPINEDLMKHLSQLSQEQRAATEPNLGTDKISIYE